MTIEKPKSEPADRDGTKTTHPAFGMIGASRVTGPAILHGSDFRHNATIMIRVHGSELRRDLSYDWHYARDRLIEVELSEAQWATFVSSLNCGDGVPCTLRYVNGEQIPGLPPPVDRCEQFSGEADVRLERALTVLRDLSAKLEDMGLPKKKAAEIQSDIRHVVSDLTANLRFVAESFGKHVEKTVEKAKAEIHGYMAGVVQRAGIAALAGKEMPLQLEGEAHARD